MKNEALPKEWRSKRLADACEVIVSPVDKKTIDGELPVKLCNYTDVYYNNTIDSKIDFMTATAKPQEIEKFSLVEGDVIITKDSETPDDIGVPTYVKETIDKLLCGYHLAVLRPKKQTIGRYVCYALTSPRVKYDFYRFANGITRFGLTTESYQKIQIPFPPISEQRAIAFLLKTWDAAIEKTEALISAKEKQFKWLLKTLISDQQDNPEWRRVTLEDACEVIISPVDKKTVDGELPVKLCNYTDVYYNDAIGYDIDFMAATAKPLEIEKFSIIEGDVIITKDSETPDDIGVPAYVKETIDNLLCGYHLAILRSKKQTIGNYVCYALISPRVKYDFYRFANGITRFGLTTESYQKIRISLPLLPEQKRIVNLLDTANKEVETLKKLAEQYRTQKRGLMQKLLMGKWRIRSQSAE